MRTIQIELDSGSTIPLVTAAQCPARVIISNPGAGPTLNETVNVSNEANAFASLGALSVPLNRSLVWGLTTVPLYGYALANSATVLVTFLDINDTFSLRDQ